MFDITRAVTHFSGLDITPTDASLIRGFTQRDISNALAHLERGDRSAEFLTFTNAAGRSVSFDLSSQTGHMPAMSQFHPA